MSTMREGRVSSSLRRPSGPTAAAFLPGDDLVEQARLAAIGRTAAGVAHDFNNIVTVISVCARLLEDQEGLDENGRQQVLTSAVRTNGPDRSSGRSSTSPIEARSPAPWSTSAASSPISSLCSARPSRRGSRSPFSRDDADHPVLADAGRLEQTLSNLATNACDAMPPTGLIDILLTRTGERNRIDVADTGTGIPPDVLLRIFEPFFSTKHAVHGTGLGLAQVKDLVAEHTARWR